MKKSDLKVGVEYACFTTVGQAREYQNSRFMLRKPFKAKLVAVDAEDYRPVPRGRYSSGYEMGRAKGVEVDIGKPTIYEDVRVTKWDDANGRSVTETKKVKVDTLMLENAGCIVSTWADHKKLLSDFEADRRDEQRRAREHRESVIANAPLIEKKAKKLATALRKLGKVKIERWDWIDGPYRLEVRDAEGYVLISGKYEYEYIGDKHYLTGVEFETHVDGLAALLGVTL